MTCSTIFRGIENDNHTVSRQTDLGTKWKCKSYDFITFSNQRIRIVHHTFHEDNNITCMHPAPEKWDIVVFSFQSACSFDI